MIAAIAAVDADWGIGYNGELLEKIPEDMKRFKELTTNHTVIMGRKTWDSLPSKPLSNRINVVVTNQKNNESTDQVYYFNWDGLMYSLILYTLTEHGYDKQLKDIFIIGGASIYEQLLPYCDTIYLTRIDKHHKNVDTYFPNFTETDDWELTECSNLKFYNDIPYQFETWTRRN